MPRRLIVTADDFGLDIAVNEAVEEAHCHGILTTASLMVGAPAVADAVARAKRLPNLRVGLHLAVIDALPVLPAETIPDLTLPSGWLRSGPARAGIAYFFGRRARAQLAKEIRAQFAAFAATGLDLDHVNAHRNMELHPTIARLMIEIGRDYGLRAVRTPDEPLDPVHRAEPIAATTRAAAAMLRPWTALLRRQLSRAGLVSSDHVFGRLWSGHMTAERLRRLLPHVPEGVSEIYFHPRAPDPDAATEDEGGHGNAEDLAALTDPEVPRLLDRHGIVLTTFGALANVDASPAAF